MSNAALFKVIKFGFTFLLVVIVTIPFLAPIFAHYGQRRIADGIYEVYSFLCHQKAHRSLFIFDEQCAWCVRDTFIWSTLLVIWLILLRKKNVPGISWKVALLFCLPMALDGTIQLVATMLSLYTHNTPFYESTNTIRAITGTLFSVGVGMFMFPRLHNELNQ